MGKEDCNLPDVWVSGTMDPFTKGYCTSQKKKLDKSKSDCTHPNVWVSGTKNPYTKGYCVEPVLKEKSPTPKVSSPKKQTPKVSSPKVSSPKKQTSDLIYSDESGKYVSKGSFSGKIAMQLELIPALKPIYIAGNNLHLKIIKIYWM